MLEAKNQLIEENDLKMKEEFRLSDGWAANMDKCPIKQFSHLGFDSIEKGIESKVLFMMGYLLTNNLITKEVEKVRVLKKTGSSKKKNKGSNNYKSIIKERYVYKECTEEDEKLFDEFKEIEEATEEKTPAEEMTKVGIEKEENDDILEFAAKIGIEKTMVENKSDGLNTNYEYEKEEWIVRPHTRTLKDGRKIVISGQRRKRRNELLTKSEENENKARKTFGITSRDIEKLNKNSMRK